VCLARLVGSLDAGHPVDGPDWVPINAAYAERFGPRAATVGPPESAHK
jgi:hypothetical protein